ncbi:MAG: protein translocase subunit SecF [Candidatus Ratteibacteria bacterium]|jgi:preprotein translocase subunit SecF
MELIKKTNFDFLGKRKWAYLFSLTVILAGIITFAIRGKSNFGVDFVGGDMLRIGTKAPSSVVHVRQAVSRLNLSEIVVQEVGSTHDQFIIKSPPNTAMKIAALLTEEFGPDFVEVKGRSEVSPSMSVSLRNRALMAFFIGLFGMLIYITIRFEFHFATCATLAIFHDLLFVVGVMVMLGYVIDTQIIAALLTIAGVSINDTIVIFDRIRESMRKTRSSNYIELFNQAINETLSRTILTGITTIIMVLLLFFLGGESLRGFSLALCIGFVVGTYSSIFVATSLLVDWQRKGSYKLRL